MPALPTGMYEINVTSAERSKVCLDRISVFNAWTQLNDLPFLFDYGCVFDFGEDIYIATAGTNSTDRDIYAFDLATKGFSMVGRTYFSSVIVDPLACTLNGKGYVIGRKSSGGVGFELFDPASMTWSRLPDYPGTQDAVPFIFADDSVVYAGGGRYYDYTTGGQYLDVWKYSPVTKYWTKLANLPDDYSFPSNQIYLNGNVLVMTINNLYIYNFSMNSWRYVTVSFVSRPIAGTVSAVLNGKWYVGCGDKNGLHFSPIGNENNAFVIYDPTSKSWTDMKSEILPPRAMPMYFTAGGYLFVGGSQRTHLYDFWMYDPSKE
jgi:N-acetylneuraminic acid mutarotase